MKLIEMWRARAQLKLDHAREMGANCQVCNGNGEHSPCPTDCSQEGFCMDTGLCPYNIDRSRLVDCKNCEPYRKMIKTKGRGSYEVKP